MPAATNGFVARCQQALVPAAAAAVAAQVCAEPAVTAHSCARYIITLLSVVRATRPCSSRQSVGGPSHYCLISAPCRAAAPQGLWLPHAALLCQWSVAGAHGSGLWLVCGCAPSGFGICTAAVCGRGRLLTFKASTGTGQALSGVVSQAGLAVGCVALVGTQLPQL